MASALASVAPPMPSSAALAATDASTSAPAFGTPAEATALPDGVAAAPGGALAPSSDLGTALAALSQALDQLSAVLAAMTGGAQVQGGGAAPAQGSGCMCGCSDAQMQAAVDQSAPRSASQSPVQAPVSTPATAVQTAPPAAPAPGADPGAKILPSGKAFPVLDGKVIGHPHEGTHTLGNWQSDNALDIEAPDGTPIYAPADGVVSKSAGDNADPSSRFNGFNFELEGEGNAWFLQHLSSSLVKDGDHVKKGQLIGHVGSANGVPHLHLGQRDGNPDDDFRL